MNYAIFQEWLMKVSLTGAAVFSAALILYILREPLRAALERLHHARRLTQFAVLAAFAGATLFGGAKHGSETNNPTGGVSGDTSPTNAPTMVGGVLRTPRNLTTNEISLCGDCISTGEAAAKRSLEWCGPGVSALPAGLLSGEATSSSLQQEEGAHHSTPTPTLYTYLPAPTLYTSISNWTARGAYLDWHRIDFPSDFAFPIGTNLLTSVTLMAYGELRQTLQGPVLVSLSDL